MNSTESFNGYAGNLTEVGAGKEKQKEATIYMKIKMGLGIRYLSTDQKKYRNLYVFG